MGTLFLEVHNTRGYFTMKNFFPKISLLIGRVIGRLLKNLVLCAERIYHIKG
jgi:hypothetical protein